jgi:hypothetical protein
VLVGLRIDLFDALEQFDDQGPLLSELGVVPAQAIKVGRDSIWSAYVAAWISL